jgi:hypothetical protein
MTQIDNQLLARDLDVFPARISITEDGVPSTYGKVRVRAMRDNSLRVWMESTSYPHTPQLIVNTTIATILSNTIGNQSIIRRKQGLIVEGIDGLMYEINPQTGCGCGSRLKSMRFNEFDNTQAVRPKQVQGKPLLDDLQLVLSANWPDQ